MSFLLISRLLVQRNSHTVNTSPNIRHYAKGGLGGISALGGKKKLVKAGPALEKKVLPVEADPEKLVNYVCGSCITQTGEDIKLKPDNEYPDWLWNMRLGKAPPFQELEYDSPEYWRRVIRMNKRNKQNLMRNKRF